ncbi:MAG: M55 family metallopeptidase [Clostridia bacterium]|nr:M55 family metallopeptidase [Clostridia bacterium]
MNFAIAVDLEGIAGVVGTPGSGLGKDNTQYAFACLQAVREVNAAVKALYDCGAKKVYVWDNHGGSLNLDYFSLDKRVEILAGVGLKHRWQGLEDKNIDGVLLIGYHAMADTSKAVLAHTCSSTSYQHVKLNNRSVGEIEIDAAMAGIMLHAPLIFVSSDDQAIAQVSQTIPWAKTVITKHSIGRNAALLKHPDTVLDEIYMQVKQAFKETKGMKLFKIKEPIEVKIRFMRLEEAENAANNKIRKTELVDPYTIKYTVNHLTEIY